MLTTKDSGTEKKTETTTADDSEVPEQYQEGCYLWGTLSGIISLDDLPEEDTCDIPEHFKFMLDVRVSEDGVVSDTTWYYPSIKEPYDIVTYFEHNFEPVRLDD